MFFFMLNPWASLHKRTVTDFRNWVINLFCTCAWEKTLQSQSSPSYPFKSVKGNHWKSRSQELTDTFVLYVCSRENEEHLVFLNSREHVQNLLLFYFIKTEKKNNNNNNNNKTFHISDVCWDFSATSRTLPTFVRKMSVFIFFFFFFFFFFFLKFWLYFLRWFIERRWCKGRSDFCSAVQYTIKNGI